MEPEMNHISRYVRASGLDRCKVDGSGWGNDFELKLGMENSVDRFAGAEQHARS